MTTATSATAPAPPAADPSLRELLAAPDTFPRRHLGSGAEDIAAMLRAVGASSLDELIDQTVPPSIRRRDPLVLSIGGRAALSESEALEHLSAVARRNQRRRALLGQGYADTIVASVPAGLLLLSSDLHVLSANRAFLEAFRLIQEDVVGRDLQQLVRADRLVRIAGRTLETRGAQPAAVYDLYVYARRETKPARVAMTAVQMADDASPRLLLVIEDVHWADADELARFGEIAAVVAQCPALLLMTTGLKAIRSAQAGVRVHAAAP